MNSNQYVDKAIYLLNNTLYTEALRECSKAIELDPNNAEVYEIKGIAYYSVEEINKALDCFNKAISLNSKSSRAFCYRGICYSTSLKATLKDIISFNKPSSFTLKGFDLDKSVIEAFTQCINDETMAIQLDSDNLQAYQARGIAYFWLEKYEYALIDLNKVINLCPNNDGFETRAQIHFLFNNYNEAINDINYVIKNNPEKPIAYDIRGRSYYLQKEYDKSVPIYQKQFS